MASLHNRKKKRVVLTLNNKLRICELAKKGRTLQSLANEFAIGKSTVHDIAKNEEKLLTFQMEIVDGDCTKKRDNEESKI